MILASGPSLTQEQIDIAQDGAEVIAVNSTWQKAPWSEVVYAGDFMWWKQNVAHVLNSPAGRCAARWTCDRSAAERWGLNWVKGVNRLGLGRDKVIHTNGNSGFQAINLAYCFGARRILLLGFDMCLGENGERHHHADHPAPMVQAQTFSDWIHKSEQFAKELDAAGCEVVNCSPRTALTCFSRSTIEKELG